MTADTHPYRAAADRARATVDPPHAAPVNEEAPAQEPAPTAEETEAAKIADIEQRARSLEEDVVTPRTMFDPELTYYADGTRVVMRAAKGTERTGTTFGMAGSGLPNVYAFQAVRWDDGSADLIAPHVLYRAEPATRTEHGDYLARGHLNGARVALIAHAHSYR
ncbi:hypothetical protein [Streptomyces griseorubiginosus]|uniref:hypothetical protein n=1 Tax=Streptomyces griseorubiginosus TaxID=67304 RepID=UPI0036E9A47D